MQRTKTQKRRLFGSLFGGKKHAEPPKTAAPVETDRSGSSMTGSVSSADALPARSNTVGGKKAPKHKPIVIEVQPEPQPEPQPDIIVEEPSWATISEPIPSVTSGGLGGLGLLSVDIPDIRLERYSVMFSGVLNPNGTKSSLLERRQATLEKLKTISDRVENEDKARPRRATSPQPMKSPAFSLFPHTPTRHSGMLAASGPGMSSTTSLALPRTLTRSNTSPAFLPSPSRASFEPRQQGSPERLRKEKKTVTVISPRTMDERNRAAQVERLREQQQAQQKQQQQTRQTTATSTKPAFYFGPNESSLILDSPPASPTSSISSSDSEFDQPTTTTTTTITVARNRLPLKPALPTEPQWQIITPPSSTTSTTASPSLNTTTTSLPPHKANPNPKRRTAPPPPPPPPLPPPSSRPSLDSIRTTGAASTTTTATTGGMSTTTFGGPLPRVSVDEEDAALKAAVEISIARQISISRQQRRLLRPFGVGAMTMSSSSSSSAGGARGRGVTLVGRGIITLLVRSWEEWRGA
ncbi:hypothetical protein NEMBOFW57_007469 [Staphylotrichum longicolle]|uniref:Uncharacterized protein n=1 Tax=Staphylotrichum longicolle TaxID=669026 RepID=A0AAD4EV59_9PEZI|nr:hypothetical protein NEMBOFW57_007469 [Staphylotrichum longicolle]